ncbi:hypothetical protein GCM10023161_25210 [Mycobacterium paraffinicum]|uniref:Uncharacterized protein n=1 Tax=Mycobacterium paraffinicum TaxID=53378 RepID=A0ABP8RM99_9MYCO
MSVPTMNVPSDSMVVFGPGGGGGAAVTVTVLVSAGTVDVTVVAVPFEPSQPASTAAQPAIAAVKGRR